MVSVRHVLSALLVLASPLAAQSARSDHAASSAPAHEEESENATPISFGLAGGALEYQGGRREQALGAVVRWAATPWLSFAATPTMVRVAEPSAAAGTLQTSSGLVDLPFDATVTHGFHARWSPGVALGLGISLPLGDTASGFGAGAVGYSVSGGVGFSPSDRVWVHLGAGRSLTDVSMQSAFTSGSGWGDASAGVSVTERVSLNGGYSTDIGAVDSTTGRSTSINGGLSYNVFGPATLNVNASHGLSGLAPRWSFALGFGTAFPYLNHLGAGSPIDQLRETFGGGTHGLGNGNGNGSSGGSTNSGRGNGRKTL
ncbi:MAG: hypothetical protein JWL95_1255 [Gemmatimonadetes bacterium]|nr:hypothetical protein [Gemmatimonadota bacterium]